MTGPPWPLFVFMGIALLACAGLVVTTILSDRKRAPVDSNSIGWIGHPARNTTCVELKLQDRNRANLLQQIHLALLDVGAVDIVEVDSTIVGWSPVSPSGLFFGWAPQQLGVSVRRLPDGQISLLCGSRARFAIAITDMGRSQEMTKRIVTTISTLVKSG